MLVTYEGNPVSYAAAILALMGSLLLPAKLCFIF